MHHPTWRMIASSSNFQQVGPLFPRRTKSWYGFRRLHISQKRLAEFGSLANHVEKVLFVVVEIKSSRLVRWAHPLISMPKVIMTFWYRTINPNFPKSSHSTRPKPESAKGIFCIAFSQWLISGILARNPNRSGHLDYAFLPKPDREKESCEIVSFILLF